MWNSLSCANRHGCHWVACCSLLRSNNNIKDRSISESSGKKKRGIQDKTGECGRSPNYNPWPGFCMNHSILNIPFKTLMAVGCWCHFIIHIWVCSPMRTENWKVPCGFCYTSSTISRCVIDPGNKFNLIPQLQHELLHLFNCAASMFRSSIHWLQCMCTSFCNVLPRIRLFL